MEIIPVVPVSLTDRAVKARRKGRQGRSEQLQRGVRKPDLKKQAGTTLFLSRCCGALGSRV